MFQVFQMFKWYVASVSREYCKSRSGCCTCCDSCTRMLQAYVPTVSSVFSRRTLQVCLFGCCICFTHCCKCFIYILHMFYNDFQMFFMCFSSVLSAFRRMLQLLHVDISKVDRVLHLIPRFLLSHLSVSSFSSQRRLGISRPLPSFSMLMMFKTARAPRGRAKWHKNGCKRRHLDVPSTRTLASRSCSPALRVTSHSTTRPCQHPFQPPDVSSWATHKRGSLNHNPRLKMLPRGSFSRHGGHNSRFFYTCIYCLMWHP
jgi:hypothetical protein